MFWWVRNGTFCFSFDIIWQCSVYISFDVTLLCCKFLSHLIIWTACRQRSHRAKTVFALQRMTYNYTSMENLHTFSLLWGNFVCGVRRGDQIQEFISNFRPTETQTYNGNQRTIGSVLLTWVLFCFIPYMYIKPQGKNRQPLASRKVLSLWSLVACFKKQLCPLILCTFSYDFIHVHSPWPGTDNPLGPKCWFH